jgi:hypothetical protein
LNCPTTTLLLEPQVVIASFKNKTNLAFSKCYLVAFVQLAPEESHGEQGGLQQIRYRQLMKSAQSHDEVCLVNQV